MRLRLNSTIGTCLAVGLVWWGGLRAEAQPVAPPAAARDAAAAPERADAPAIDPAVLELPAVQAVLASNPQTPRELVRAILILVELKHPEVARPLVEELIALDLDRESLVALARVYDPAVFLRLSLVAELAPLAGEFADTLSAALADHATDPERLAELAAALGDPSPAVHRAAARELLVARSAAVGPLLDVLSDPNLAAAHPLARAAIVSLGTDARGPLFAALAIDRLDDFANDQPLAEHEARAARIATAAAEALAVIDDPLAWHVLLARAVSTAGPTASAAPLAPLDDDGAARRGDALSDVRRAVDAAARRAVSARLGGLPAPRATAERLARLADDLHTGSVRLAPADMASFRWWHWDPQTAVLVEEWRDEAAVRSALAAQLARVAFKLEPHDPWLRQLLARTLIAAGHATAAEAAAEGEGPGAAETHASAAAPWWNEALSLGPATILEVLRQALHEGERGDEHAARHAAIAVGAIDLLGAPRGPAGPESDFDAELRSRIEPLLTPRPSGEPATLVRALRHPDRRVRMAALETVLALDDPSAFGGSSFVPEALGYFATSTGRPQALAVHIHSTEALRWAGWLGELGFDAQIATDGREAIRLATQMADCELILLWVGLVGTSVEDTLAQLRADYRTRLIPVGVVSDVDRFDRAERATRREQRVAALVRPRDVGAMAFHVEELSRLAPDLPPAQERLAQAALTVQWIGYLAERRGLFDIDPLGSVVAGSLSVAPLSVEAATALGWIARPTAQRTLVDVASRETADFALRAAAARAFCTSVGRHGILLTAEEMLLQYDRYNDSARADRATQEMLASILDCLEAGRAPRLSAQEEIPSPNP